MTHRWVLHLDSSNRTEHTLKYLFSYRNYKLNLLLLLVPSAGLLGWSLLLLVPIAGLSNCNKLVFVAVLSTSFFLFLPFNLTGSFGCSLDVGSSIETGWFEPLLDLYMFMCTTKYLRSKWKMIMQNKFRFSIGYLFDAPELEETRFPFFLLVISKLRIKKTRVLYL